MIGELLSNSSGIVLWSRIRLCRNLAGHHFISSEKGKKKQLGSSAINPPRTRCATYEKIADAVQAVSAEKALTLKRLGDVPDWKIIELFEQGLISEYFKKRRDDASRGVVTAPGGEVPAMVNERHHLVIQNLRPGLQLEHAWRAVDMLDDLFSSELEFAWDKKFGYLVPDSECCGTGLDVMVNTHLPGLILLDEMIQVVAAFGAVGLNLDTEIADDVLVSGFGQTLRVTNNMRIVDSEHTVLNRMEQAISALVQQEEQARQRILKKRYLKLLLYNKISRALAVLRNSLLVSRADTFEFLSWLRVGTALDLVRGISSAQVDSLHRDLWASNFLSGFKGSFEDAVEHVNLTRAAILMERLKAVELAFK